MEKKIAPSVEKAQALRALLQGHPDAQKLGGVIRAVFIRVGRHSHKA